MSGQDIDQQILNDKINKFSEAFEKLQQEHGIIVLPTLEYSAHGMFPKLTYGDKAKVEAQLRAAAGQQQVVKPE